MQARKGREEILKDQQESESESTEDPVKDYYKDYLKQINRKAADGDAEAQYSLGFMHITRYKSITGSQETAIEWFTKAAEQGHAKAQYELGRLYFGFSSYLGEVKSAEWLIKAAEQGIFEAQTELSFRYCLGIGVPKDKSKAAEWLNKAIEMDAPKAYWERGDSFILKKNYDMAIDDLSNAIKYKPNYPNALNKRGDLYMKKGDIDKALADYEKSNHLEPDNVDVKRSLLEALTILSLRYCLGKGVQKDETKAAELFNRATEIDISEANWQRGKLFMIEEKYDMAIDDLSNAIKNNPKNSDVFLERGHAYKKKGELDKALADYKEFNEREPSEYADNLFNETKIEWEKEQKHISLIKKRINRFLKNPIIIIITIVSLFFNNTLLLISQARAPFRTIFNYLIVIALLIVYNNVLKYFLWSTYDTIKERKKIISKPHMFRIYFFMIILITSIYGGLYFLIMHLLFKVW